MKTKAQHKNARMAPRKLRLLRDVVRGLPVSEARAKLTFMPGKASTLVLNVLNSAVANAMHNNELQESSLIVEDVQVDGGFVLKRFNPVSRGMAHPINKRTSHITVIVQDTTATTNIKSKKKAAAIKTITADQHIKEHDELRQEVDQEADEPEPKQPEVVPQDESEKVKSKQQMMQKGGDRAKSQRRRSKKDS